MEMNNVTVVEVPVSLLGEGPVWDEQAGVLYWLDILNGTIHRYNPANNAYRQLALGEKVGAIALCDGGHFIAAMDSGIALVQWDSARRTILCHPERGKPGNRYNDGKCDGAGRFWIGSIGLAEEKGVASLYTVDKHSHAEQKLADLTISNGMAWTADNRVFYFIDTPTLTVAAFDFNLQSGALSNRRVAIQIPPDEGYPDGMTIDAGGMLWIAHWDGWQVARWDPHTGQKLASIGLPVARPTSCTFGGPGLQDLYITSARKELSSGQLAEQPLAGSLFVVKNCGYKGTATARFAQQRLPAEREI